MHSIIQTPIYLVKMSFLSTVFSLKQYILGKKKSRQCYFGNLFLPNSTSAFI